MKSIKERAAQGLDSYGLNIGMSDPVVIEMAAKAGYDFVRLDFEHMLFDYGSAANMIRTARLLDMPVQVRVPDLNHASALLDLGVSGLMVPHTSSKAIAEAAVSAVKYGPLGDRGMSGAARVLGFGEMKLNDYSKWANDYVTLIIQIEDKEGLENIDSILSVPGVDMVATGKNDLSQALGIPGQNSHPDVIAAENLVIRKALEYGKYPTLMVKNKKRLSELKEAGVHCFTISRDETLLVKAMKETLAEMKGDE